MIPKRPVIQDAAAAVIRLPGERYLMQLRTRNADIWYPGCWGCFGGAIDAGENPLAALRRELREEIELEVDSPPLITNLEFDFSPLGLGRGKRLYYLVDITDAALRGLRLHEGERMQAFTYAELVSGLPLVPYDAFAVHLIGSDAARPALPRYNAAPGKSRP